MAAASSSSLSSSSLSTSSSVTIACPASTSLSLSVRLDSTLFLRLFPSKEESKRDQWLKTILTEEFETLEDLAKLSESSWNQINLPVAVKETLKQTAAAACTITQAALPTLAAQPPAYDPSYSPSASNAAAAGSRNPLTQIDCILVDISSSMKAKSSIDSLKTREDVSKMVFHVLVDKLVALELDHAVGLIAFGQNVSIVQKVTREYERFHDQLGRLDANEGSTKLYDAIFEAACFLEQYANDNWNELCKNTGQRCQLRIFALTDGEDNASHQQAWKVTQHLQQHGIVLDCLPLAGSNNVLQAMATATGGMCFRCANSEQSVALFERQAVLHIAFREKSSAIAAVTDNSSLMKLVAHSTVHEDVRSAEPTAAKSKTVSDEQVRQRAAANSNAALKRIYKEYQDMLEAESSTGIRAWMNEDSAFSWKALIPGPKNSPYDGGRFILLVAFPQDYPFKPPKVQFLTPVYHCNINGDGFVCLDILKDNWSPALTCSKVMLSLQSLLAQPNAQDPLDAVKADIFRVDRARYEREARAMVEKNAMSTPEELKAKYDIDLNSESLQAKSSSSSSGGNTNAHPAAAAAVAAATATIAVSSASTPAAS